MTLFVRKTWTRLKSAGLCGLSPVLTDLLCNPHQIPSFKSFSPRNWVGFGWHRNINYSFISTEIFQFGTVVQPLNDSKKANLPINPNFPSSAFLTFTRSYHLLFSLLPPNNQAVTTPFWTLFDLANQSPSFETTQKTFN